MSQLEGDSNNGRGGEEKKRANERVVEGFDGQVAGLGDK